MNKIQIAEVINVHKVQFPETYNDVIRLTKPFYTFHKKLFYEKCKMRENKYNLLNSEFDVLASLMFVENQSLYAKQISNYLLFTSGGLTKVLKKLELKGYIISIEGEFDKRKKLIKITKEGESIFKEAIKETLDYEETCFNRLNKHEKNQLEKILLKLID